MSIFWPSRSTRAISFETSLICLSSRFCLALAFFDFAPEAAFLAAGVLAAAFFTELFFAADFFAADFFAAAFFVTAFLPADFLAAGFLAAGFFAADFLAAAFSGAEAADAGAVGTGTGTLSSAAAFIRKPPWSIARLQMKRDAETCLWQAN
ncbi:MAG: hypothetical protein RLN89_04110 [Parvibaculum sp.]